MYVCADTPQNVGFSNTTIGKALNVQFFMFTSWKV